jgi:hypothetical protein
MAKPAYLEVGMAPIGYVSNRCSDVEVGDHHANNDLRVRSIGAVGVHMETASMTGCS